MQSLPETTPRIVEVSPIDDTLLEPAPSLEVLRDTLSLIPPFEKTVLKSPRNVSPYAQFFLPKEKKVTKADVDLKETLSEFTRKNDQKASEARYLYPAVEPEAQGAQADEPSLARDFLTVGIDGAPATAGGEPGNPEGPGEGVRSGQYHRDPVVGVHTIQEIKISLIIPMYIILDDGSMVPLRALIDTGCEMNLIKVGLVDPKFFQPAARRMRLIAANGSHLMGGDKTASLDLTVRGYQVDTGAAKVLEFRTPFYEAGIDPDVILSYAWLVGFNLNVQSRQYGLQTNSIPAFFIPGVGDSSLTLRVRPIIGMVEGDCAPPLHGEYREFIIREDLEWQDDHPSVMVPPDSDSEDLAQYFSVLSEIKSEALGHMAWKMGNLGMKIFPHEEVSEKVVREIARNMVRGEETLKMVRKIVVTGQPYESPQVQSFRDKILHRFKDTVFRTKMGHHPPIRGPFCEATISIKPGFVPVKQRSFRLVGERRDGLIGLIDGLLGEDKIEVGAGPWNSPAFPVPKKVKGDWRLVIDYRAVNSGTVNDSHPLPRIDDILQRQGKFLDLDSSGFEGWFSPGSCPP